MSFGQKQDPCVGVFGKLMSIFKSKIVARPAEQHNLGVTVLPNHPGFQNKGDEKTTSGHNPDIKNVWLGTDNSLMMKMDPISLKVEGFASQKDMNPELSGPIACAHSQRDHLTGDLYNFNLAFGKEAVYKVFRVSAHTGETDILATLSGPRILPAYIHSFFLTDDFVVLAIWSSHFGLNGLKIMWNQNILDGIDPFDKSKAVKWLVIDRKHGKGLVAEFDSEAAFSFHTVNAWQESSSNGTFNIICDVICYDSLDILHSLYYTNIRSEGEGAVTFANEKGDSSRSHFARFRLTSIDPSRPLVRGPKVTAPLAEELFRVKSPHTGDLPTINPLFSTRRSRYVYTLVNRGYSAFIDGISKFDTETRNTIFWDNPFGHTPGEAIFVPNPDGTEEDDGVLLSVILDGIKGTSYLVCLSAKTMEEVGKASVGSAVALGFHGTFVAGN
ncbi:hypothetical protein ONS96_010280 [Cadophora gregata f. sp. sojae]|nr:hypothetical protein ONS96_010280 [Cadophora gregata f. sp. sojae]